MNLFQSISPVRKTILLSPLAGSPARSARVQFFSDGAPASAIASRDGNVPAWNRGQRVTVEAVKPPPPPPRPEGPKPIGDWVASLSRTYKKWYWINKKTNETSWETPKAPAPPPPPASMSGASRKVQSDKLERRIEKMRVRERESGKEKSEEESEEDEEMYDSDGYGDVADRERVNLLPYLERETLLADRLEERDIRMHTKRLLSSDRKKAAPRAKVQRPKAERNLVGKRVRMSSGGGVGLVVQRRGEGGEHRIVWEDGSPDEWVDLGEVRWELMGEPGGGQGGAKKGGGAGRGRVKRERAKTADDSDSEEVVGLGDSSAAGAFP